MRSTEVSGAVMTDSVELVLREDGVAQEGDETFTLTLVSTTSSSFEANFFLVDKLNVTIFDADGELSIVTLSTIINCMHMQLLCSNWLVSVQLRK